MAASYPFAASPMAGVQRSLVLAEHTPASFRHNPLHPVDFMFTRARASLAPLPTRWLVALD
jgi:hypothetical protein